MKTTLLFACLLFAGCASQPNGNTVEYRAVCVNTGVTEVVKHKCKNASLSPFNKLEPVRVDFWGNITQDTTDSQYIILEQIK